MTKGILFSQAKGATESINLGIKGVMEKFEGLFIHIITQETEHLAVLDSFKINRKKMKF